ncbi:hypothetical protein, partial [Mesorhizobium amorphae]|uniref:hypothetical protein n=1 Tax=Mesorhizobium amorphae TaxID=71433 RepID=UPI0024E0F1F8
PLLIHLIVNGSLGRTVVDYCLCQRLFLINRWELLSSTTVPSYKPLMINGINSGSLVSISNPRIPNPR